MLLEVGREGAEQGRLVEWSGERPLVIGRGRDVDVPIPDPRLSRRHCQLEVVDGVLTISDLASANGTFQNDVEIERSALKLDDKITFGSSWLRLVPETAPHDAAPPAPETTRRTDLRNAPTAPERPASDEDLAAPSIQGVAPSDQDATESGPPGAARGAPGAPEIDGYDVLEQVGRGSFGVVYRAKKRGGGGVTAIKVLPTGPEVKPEVVARFLREIEAAGQLDHPNLVRVLGAGETETFAYLIMEYCAGETLAVRLQRAGRMAPEAALEVARQLASGLEHAFSRGFVHRDVKPENILLDERGTPKLCDFGLVKSLGASTSKGLTRPGQGFGSVAYMPPEQVRSAFKADQRADVYSIGATLYYMLSGHRPYSGKVTKSLLRRVLEEMPEPILDHAPDVPAPAVRLVEKCLQKDPQDRFQTPKELREAIEACAVQIAGARRRGVSKEALTSRERPAARLPAPTPSAANRAFSPAAEAEALADFATGIESDLAIDKKLDAPDPPPPPPPAAAHRPPFDRPATPPPTDVTAPLARLAPGPPPPEHGIETKRVKPPSGESEGAVTMPLQKTGAPEPAAARGARPGLFQRIFKRFFG